MATYIIIGITCVISYFALNNRDIFNRYLHSPYIEHRNKEFIRILSSGFLHGDLTHLLVNMYVLFVFGEYVEKQFVIQYGPSGQIYYVLCYMIIIVMANIPTFYKHKDNQSYRSIGASGATSGILFLYVLFNPWSTLLLFFIIPVPAILLALGYLYYSHWASKNQNDLIDHQAHFWGAVAGIVLGIILLPAAIPTFIEKILQPQFLFW